MVPLVLCGLGCVSLDKPAKVAACASSNTCSDGEKKDAAVSKDGGAYDSGVTRDSTSPTTDTRVEGDSAPTPDGVSADRADAGRADGTGAGADTATDLPDAGQPDTRGGDDTAPDGAPSPDVAPFADAPKDSLGADTADATVADTNPLPMDTGPNNVTTFSAGKGVGLLTGYGWVSPGTADTVSSPTCGGTAITASAPCQAGTTWNSVTDLCVDGLIPSLAASPNTSTNWGIQVGVNATVGGIGKAFSTVAIKVSSMPAGANDVRIELHLNGDGGGDTYCAHWANSATSVSLTSFNRNCWDNSGAYLTAADVPTIDKVGLQVSPSKTDDLTLTNLCMESITFGN